MSTIRISGLRAVRAAAALALSVAFLDPALARDPSPIDQPGSPEAIMGSKLPGVYGPHLPVPPAGASKHWPTPGSAEALGMARTPWLYGPKTLPADTGPICPNAHRYPPGSFQALTNAKMPGSYGPRRCKGGN